MSGGVESGGGEPSSNEPGGVSPDGDDAEASVWGLGTVCGGLICGGAWAIGCSYVTSACVMGDAITLGGATVPCAVAIAGACLGPLACMYACMGVP